MLPCDPIKWPYRSTIWRSSGMSAEDYVSFINLEHFGKSYFQQSSIDSQSPPKNLHLNSIVIHFNMLLDVGFCFNQMRVA